MQRTHLKANIRLSTTGCKWLRDNERILLYHHSTYAPLVVYRGTVDGDGTLLVTSFVITSDQNDRGLLQALAHREFAPVKAPIRVHVPTNRGQGNPLLSELPELEFDLIPTEMAQLVANSQGLSTTLNEAAKKAAGIESKALPPMNPTTVENATTPMVPRLPRKPRLDVPAK
jgi:hypothetical protein